MFSLIQMYIVQIKIKYFKVSIVVVFGMNHEIIYILFEQTLKLQLYNLVPMVTFKLCLIRYKLLCENIT